MILEVRNLIYITSDTHLPHDIHKLNRKKFGQRVEAKEGDVLLICGDFGGVWAGDGTERYWLDWFSNKPYTTLFIDGNHENHQRLHNDFPEVDYGGGKAHRITDKLFHLMRGYVYEIQGQRFFCMGGAESHDKAYRTEGLNWWPEEMPSIEEYRRAEDQLEACGWQVDYVLSHCAPDDIQREFFPSYPENELTNFLQTISQKLSFKHWYFGHYHKDTAIWDRYTCLYDSVTSIR